MPLKLFNLFSTTDNHFKLTQELKAYNQKIKHKSPIQTRIHFKNKLIKQDNLQSVETVGREIKPLQVLETTQQSYLSEIETKHQNHWIRSGTRMELEKPNKKAGKSNTSERARWESWREMMDAASRFWFSRKMRSMVSWAMTVQRDCADKP